MTATYRLALALLIGCTICVSSLYARENGAEVENLIHKANILFANDPSAKQQWLSALNKGDTLKARRTIHALDSARFSKDQEEVAHFFTAKANQQYILHIVKQHYAALISDCIAEADVVPTAAPHDKPLESIITKLRKQGPLVYLGLINNQKTPLEHWGSLFASDILAGTQFIVAILYDDQLAKKAILHKKSLEQLSDEARNALAFFVNADNDAIIYIWAFVRNVQLCRLHAEGKPPQGEWHPIPSYCAAYKSNIVCDRVSNSFNLHHATCSSRTTLRKAAISPSLLDKEDKAFYINYLIKNHSDDLDVQRFFENENYKATWDQYLPQKILDPAMHDLLDNQIAENKEEAPYRLVDGVFTMCINVPLKVAAKLSPPEAHHIKLPSSLAEQVMARVLKKLSFSKEITLDKDTFDKIKDVRIHNLADIIDGNITLDHTVCNILISDMWRKLCSSDRIELLQQANHLDGAQLHKALLDATNKESILLRDGHCAYATPKKICLLLSALGLKCLVDLVKNAEGTLSSPSDIQAMLKNAPKKPPPSPLSHIKSGKFTALGITLGTAAAGASIYAYNKYIANKKKTMAADAGSASSHKKWLFFILCLLMSGLLLMGIFARKKAPLWP